MPAVATELMLEVYLKSDLNAGTDLSGALAVESRLEEMASLLEKLVLQDRSNALECRAWLSTSLFRHQNVPGYVRRQCLYPFVELSGKQLPDGVQPPTLQLLQLWCEKRPQQAGRLLADQSNIMKSFFKDSPLRMTLWFSHFSMQGLSHFKHGARALALFALANREDVWHHLVWRGRHSQAPVAVAAKPHYFCELDVVPTLENMLRDCPSFWTSQLWSESLQSGDIIGIDYGWFCQCLLEVLQGEDDAAFMVERALKDFVVEEDFCLLGQRLLHLLSKQQLLQLVNALSQSSSKLEVSLAESSLQDLMPLVFAQAHWRSLDQVLLCHALACCRAQLRQMLQQDEEATEQLQKLQQQAVQLHTSCSTAVHRSMLEGMSNLDSTRCRKLLLMHMWTLQLALMQQLRASPSSLPNLLFQHGIPHAQVQGIGVPFTNAAQQDDTNLDRLPGTLSNPPASTSTQALIHAQDDAAHFDQNNGASPGGLRECDTQEGETASTRHYALLDSPKASRSKKRKHKHSHNKGRSRRKEHGHKKKKKKHHKKSSSKGKTRSTKQSGHRETHGSGRGSPSVLPPLSLTSSSASSAYKTSEESDSETGSEKEDKGLGAGRRNSRARAWRNELRPSNREEEGYGMDAGNGEEAREQMPPWLLTSWRVQLSEQSFVANAIDIVDLLTCHALRTWLLQKPPAQQGDS